MGEQIVVATLVESRLEGRVGVLNIVRPLYWLRGNMFSDEYAKIVEVGEELFLVENIKGVLTSERFERRVLV